MGKYLNEWEAVHEALKVAAEFDLQTEVVLYAFKYLKENPSLTIDEVMTMSLNEWIK